MTPPNDRDIREQQEQDSIARTVAQLPLTAVPAVEAVEPDWGRLAAEGVLERVRDGQIVGDVEADPDAAFEAAVDGLKYLATLRADVERLAADAARWQALRPLMQVGESESESWCLWCVPPTMKNSEELHAIYGRGPRDDEEEDGIENGEPSWGPSVEVMVDEMIERAARRQGTSTPDSGEPTA